MTSGAFYAHFSSKAEAFRRSVEVGLCRLAEGIQAIRKKEGKNWPDALAELYVTDLRTCDLQESCALQSLTGDVFRADERTKAVFARGLEDVLIEAVGNEGDPDCRENIIALLALLSGGVSMARAVDNEELAAEIAEAVRSAAKKIHHM